MGAVASILRASKDRRIDACVSLQSLRFLP